MGTFYPVRGRRFRHRLATMPDRVVPVRQDRSGLELAETFRAGQCIGRLEQRRTEGEQ